MGKEQLFRKFWIMFPDWAAKATSYKKIGSKCLAITFKSGISRVFLYVDENNWQFGTKLWRKRPDRIEKKSLVISGG